MSQRFRITFSKNGRTAQADIAAESPLKARNAAKRMARGRGAEVESVETILPGFMAGRRGIKK